MIKYNDFPGEYDPDQVTHPCDFCANAPDNCPVVKAMINDSEFKDHFREATVHGFRDAGGVLIRYDNTITEIAQADIGLALQGDKTSGYFKCPERKELTGIERWERNKAIDAIINERIKEQGLEVPEANEEKQIANNQM